MINVCKWFVTFGQPYLRASATACRLIKSPISLISLQMPCRIRGCLMRSSLPVMMDLGPFAPKCDQQRAKKSFVVFCRNGTGKKTEKGKTFSFGFPLQKLTHHMQSTSRQHLEYHSVPTSLNDMLWLLYQWTKGFKNRKLYATRMVASRNGKHISHLLLEGNHPMVVYPNFRKLRFHGCCTDILLVDVTTLLTFLTKGWGTGIPFQTNSLTFWDVV